MARIIPAEEGRTHKVSADTCPVSYEVKVLTETVVKTDAAERYRGPYTAVPQTVPVRLETKDRYLTEDITIFRIPYWETANRDGTTVYIGGGENNGI